MTDRLIIENKRARFIPWRQGAAFQEGKWRRVFGVKQGNREMKGECFAWLSHDDIFKPKHVERHIEYLSRHENEQIIVLTKLEIINSFGSIIYPHSTALGPMFLTIICQLKNMNRLC